MQEVWNSFMHIYFWVWLVTLALTVIANSGIKAPRTWSSVHFWSVIGVTLWIMSWWYD